MLKTLMMSTALALVLTTPALAQQSEGRSDEVQQRQSDLSEEQQGRETERAPDERPTNQVTLADANSVQGSEVSTAQGETIGQVEDVVLDVKRGQVAYAIIGVGGFLGAGEKNVAVPWDRLIPGQESQSYVLNVDRQTLEAAPSIDPNNLAQLEDQTAQRSIASFWEEAATQQAQTPQSPQTQSPQDESR